MTTEITQPVSMLVHNLVILVDEFPLLPVEDCTQKICPLALGLNNPEMACGLLQVQTMEMGKRLANLYTKAGFAVKKFIIRPKSWNMQKKRRIKTELKKLGVEVEYITRENNLERVFSKPLLNTNQKNLQEVFL